jgi:hypothetical protein
MAATPMSTNGDAARVWFLRPSSAAEETYGAMPTIYANGAPIGTILANSDFYRDFAPGTCGFTVQPYGLPTGETVRLQLAPGSQTYIEVLWVPNWEEGVPSGRGGDVRSFYLFTMTPQLAQPYLPGLTYLARG